MKNLKKRKRELDKKGQNELAQKMNFFPVTFSVPSEYSLF